MISPLSIDFSSRSWQGGWQKADGATRKMPWRYCPWPCPILSIAQTHTISWIAGILPSRVMELVKRAVVYRLLHQSPVFRLAKALAALIEIVYGLWV